VLTTLTLAAHNIYFRQRDFIFPVSYPSNIVSQKHLQELLAAIFTFAMYHRDDLSRANSDSCSVSLGSTTSQFEVADCLIREGLDECPDEAPPINLLRVMVIITFQRPIRAVRGKAWQALGESLHIAYELQLHLADLNKTEIPQKTRMHNFNMAG
jgi:hypothetical protein